MCYNTDIVLRIAFIAFMSNDVGKSLYSGSHFEEVCTNFADKLRLLGQHSSPADSSYEVYLFVYY